jgi:uncharacterized protein (DUF2344 family)
MYTQVWTKYLPVIRVMLKRSVASPQVLKLNRTDFDKAGGGKKVGFKFLVEFKNGKVQNRFTSAIAKDLVTVIQQDEATMNILSGKEFEIDMNPKCEVNLKYTSAPQEEIDEEEVVAEETA